MNTKLQHALLILIFSFTFNAESNSNRPLTDDIIARWIESQQAFLIWGEAHQDKILDYENAGSSSNNPLAISAEEMVAPLRESGMGRSAEQLIQKHGFSSLEEWAEITLRITRAAAALQVSTQANTFDASELEELRRSGKLSEQQEEMVTRAIKQNDAMLDYLQNQVSQSDKTAVKKRLSALQHLFE